jgi:5-methylthioadenosine/S-adenosylhomocysteine deaminase
MYLASGFAAAPEMLRKNLVVSLGTDGAASNNTTNYLESMKMAALVQKAVKRDASVMTAEQILRMATIDGAKALKLDAITGSVEEGKKADLIIFNPAQLTSYPVHDPLVALVYSSTLNNIETTIVNGETVYCNGIFKGNPDMLKFYSETFDQLKQIQI